jgi:hypothetical protein
MDEIVIVSQVKHAISVGQFPHALWASFDLPGRVSTQPPSNFASYNLQVNTLILVNLSVTAHIQTICQTSWFGR